MTETDVFTGSLRVNDSPFSGVLRIALIAPNASLCNHIADALAARQEVVLRQYVSYPDRTEELDRMLDRQFDAVILDLDSDSDRAFSLAEKLGSAGIHSVMGASSRADFNLAIRFMRAGIREFLTIPLSESDLTGALERIALRRPVAHRNPRACGQLFVFLGVKGGCGVTTIASNFAVALAQESSRNTLLIDFGQPIGDTAIHLGMVNQYSIDDALREQDRLDTSFLTSLVARHPCGLSVLAAPGDFSAVQPSAEAIGKFLSVALRSYDYVVADAGSRLDLFDTPLVREAAALYLIVQVGISELRNANRFITRYFPTLGRALQIVLNRYSKSVLLFNDEQIEKALTRPAQWKIPDDYATARRTQNTITPLALENSDISRAIRRMARAACGVEERTQRKNSILTTLFS